MSLISFYGYCSATLALVVRMKFSLTKGLRMVFSKVEKHRSKGLTIWWLNVSYEMTLDEKSSNRMYKLLWLLNQNVISLLSTAIFNANSLGYVDNISAANLTDQAWTGHGNARATQLQSLWGGGGPAGTLFRGPTAMKGPETEGTLENLLLINLE